MSGDSIAFIRSANYGLTWTDRQIICPGSATADYLNPSCAFGWFSTPPESMSVGVAWQYLDNTATVREIRFRKNTLNGMPGFWRPTINFTSPANCYDGFPCLQMTHGGHPSAVITFVRKDTLGTDKAHLCYFFSTNGGNTWNSGHIYTSSYATNVPQDLVVDDTLGYYHVAFRDQDGSMIYQKARYDSISSPWSSPVYFSSGNNWSDWDLPAIGVRNGEPYVAWVDYHSPVYKLKFDAQWLLTAVNEHKSASLPNLVAVSPNPAKGAFTVHYQVNNPGRVRIALYDALGRLVRNVLECEMMVGQHQTKIETKTLAAGTYFVVIDILDQTWKKWIVIMK
ncbi:MAG: T9SS type A sorting domain-containing protein [candidate division WOR-3 bacterium]